MMNDIISTAPESQKVRMRYALHGWKPQGGAGMLADRHAAAPLRETGTLAPDFLAMLDKA